MNYNKMTKGIRSGKIIRQGEAIFRVINRQGHLRPLCSESFDLYIKCLNIIKLEDKIAELDQRIDEAAEAVLRKRAEGMPTADAVEVMVELRRHRDLCINKLSNYKRTEEL